VSGELFSASATEVLRRYRSRELSPVEYVSALITRIETCGADVNALGDTYFEVALEQARAAEALYVTDGDFRA
jgi:Asp-tRNA(Asn)/Glu-tRNA(Gln) amidotransferase A subunit family amidase